jgi:uncharacterized protein (DUF1330 family)
VSAYLISRVEVLDPVAWESDRSRVAAAIAKFGGRYRVRGALAEVIEPIGLPRSHRRRS